MGSSPLARGLLHWSYQNHLPKWDHPRSRGVYKNRRHHVVVRRGSSPLARGLRRGGLATRRGWRIIPARAGFTSRRRPRRGRRWDHPRSRGVYLKPSSVRTAERGSSPLARGLPSAGAPLGAGARIIPARAGFTCWRPRRAIPLRDHPRSRGVYGCPDFGGVAAVGSSPLARGLRPRGCPAASPSRIIPARAGFTPARSSLRRSPRDHPRSRGVYLDDVALAEAEPGSSPLARGLLVAVAECGDAEGIIPARAGFTPQGVRMKAAGGDHPRSRGVYRARPVSSTSPPGSSPLARGLRDLPFEAGAGRWIIPARAGFTRRRRTGCGCSWDHPRSRGVYGVGA